ncbi:MAG: hypothetical protein AAF798_03115 [Bacteroidota bacterium]
MEQESDVESMVRRLTHYLNGEQQIGIALLGVGILALGIGGLMLYTEITTLYRAMSWILVLTGGVQLLYAGTILWESQQQRQRLSDLVRRAPRDYIHTELHRLAQLAQQFSIKQAAGMGLFLVGLAMTLLPVFGLMGRWQMGLGIGLCLQVGILFVLELYRQWQVGMYRHEVERFGKNIV